MPDTDRHISKFAALISLAIRTLNTHTNDADLCAVHGCAWPCEQAAAGPALRSVATPIRGGGGR